jgi:hypothetical protein
MMRMKRPIDPKLTQAAAKRIIEAAEHRPLDPRVQAFLDRYFPTNRPERAS